jgi:HAD superfamily hydrolase (TIGR01490 family)
MRAALFDLDGTLTTAHIWKGVIQYFARRGLRRRTHLAYIGIHYGLYLLRRLRLISEDTFRQPWATHLAWYVRGYTPEQTQEVWDWIAGEFLAAYWRSDVLARLDRHRAEGDVILLVSAGPTPALEAIAQYLGLEHAVGTDLELRNGRWSGRSIQPACLGRHKASLTQRYLLAHSIRVNLGESYAYADSISDLQLLEMVGHPTPVYPDKELRSLAQARGWQMFSN